MHVRLGDKIVTPVLFNRRPCGGTRVANVGEIGTIRVSKISNQGKRNKRVEIALAD